MRRNDISTEPFWYVTLEYMQRTPLTVMLVVLLITICVLLNSNIIPLNCEHTFLKEILRIFEHISPIHILFNILGLLFISRIEYLYGSLAFGLGVFSLVCFTGFVEYSLRFSAYAPCSIGFSGIVLGLAVLEIVQERRFCWNTLAAIIVVVAYPNLMSPRTSLTGHLVGILCGAVLGYLYPRDMFRILYQVSDHIYENTPTLSKTIVNRDFLSMKLFNPLDTNQKVPGKTDSKKEAAEFIRYR